MTNTNKRTVTIEGLPSGVNIAVDFVPAMAKQYGDRLEKVEIATGKVTFTLRAATPPDEHRVWGNVPSIESEGETVAIDRSDLATIHQHLDLAASAYTQYEHFRGMDADPEAWLKQESHRANTALQLLKPYLRSEQKAEHDDAETITVAVAQLKRAVKHAVNAGGDATWEELRALTKTQLIELLRYSEREANNAANILRALLGEVYFGDNHDES